MLSPTESHSIVAGVGGASGAGAAEARYPHAGGEDSDGGDHGSSGVAPAPRSEHSRPSDEASTEYLAARQFKNSKHGAWQHYNGMAAPGLTAMSIAMVFFFSRDVIIASLSLEDRDSAGADFNSPLGAVLSVAGLVYALIFATSYQGAVDNLRSVTDKVGEEATAILRLSLTTRSMKLVSGAQEAVVRLVLQTLCWYNRMLLLEIADEKATLNQGPANRLYSIVPLLREGPADGVPAIADRNDAAFQQVMAQLDTLVAARLDRFVKTRWRVAKAVWAFLILLAMLTFVGVLLLQSGSGALDFLLCASTVLSITLSLFMLADIARPFRGSVQCDVMPLVQALQDVEGVLLGERRGGSATGARAGDGGVNEGVAVHSLLIDKALAGDGRGEEPGGDT